jgi:hypothetical protein
MKVSMVLSWTLTTGAIVSLGWPGCSVPKGFGHEEEDEEETETDDNGGNPEDPSPAQRLHNNGTDQRNQVLSAKQK